MLNDKMKGITKMKKARFLVGAIALAVLAAIIVACTKEKEKKAARNSSEMVTVSKEDDMSAYLKQFKEKMQSVSKGDETLSLEDARWHLEAVLNYTYGDAGYQTSDIQCDTFFYELPTNGEEVTFAQLNEAFNKFSKDVEDSFVECVLPEKSVLAIQTTFEKEMKNNSVEMQIVLYIRGLTTFKMWFDSTDYWSEYYNDVENNGSGKCGPYAGQCLDSGAPHELTKLANLRIPVYGCPEGYKKYQSEVHSTGWIHSFDDEFFIDNNSPCGYKNYVNPLDPDNPYHNPSYCIPPEDMNYYLSKFPEIAEHFLPIGMTLIGVIYHYDTMDTIPGEIVYAIELLYAEVHCEYIGTGGDQ